MKNPLIVAMEKYGRFLVEEAQRRAPDHHHRWQRDLPRGYGTFGEARFVTLPRIWGLGIDLTLSKDHVSAQARFGPLLADVSATLVEPLPADIVAEEAVA